MKKNLNYSSLILLFSFISFACSKESDEVVPTASLQRESIGNAKYCPPPIEEVCAYSQGRYFNRGGRGPGAGWEVVFVGEAPLFEGYSVLGGRMTDADKAIFQAATLILSANEQGIRPDLYRGALPPDVQAAFNCIVALNTGAIEDGECSASNYKLYADIISQWIDANHCED